MKVLLFYLSPNRVGGWVSFTQHLVAGLQQLGHEPEVLEIKQNTSPVVREAKKTGLRYRNVSLQDAQQLAGEHLSLIVVLGKQYHEQGFKLLAQGVPIVIHDPMELVKGPVREHLDPSRVFVIRPRQVQHLPGSTFIPHPYHRRLANQRSKREINAVSISRVDFDKNTDILIAANKLVEEDQRILIHGMNLDRARVYIKHKLGKLHPDWSEHLVPFRDEVRNYALRACHRSRLMVDMSTIKGDGGGSQYTFMEAWDAGAVPVVHREWLQDDTDDPQPTFMRDRVNCLAAGDGEELARLLRLSATHPRAGEQLDELVAAGRRQLATAHDPRAVAAEYVRYLERWT